MQRVRYFGLLKHLMLKRYRLGVFEQFVCLLISLMIWSSQNVTTDRAVSDYTSHQLSTQD